MVGCSELIAPRFNEAPANSPGNPGAGAPTMRGGGRGFNEAPANSPGNRSNVFGASQVTRMLQ